MNGRGSGVSRMSPRVDASGRVKRRPMPSQARPTTSLHRGRPRQRQQDKPLGPVAGRSLEQFFASQFDNHSLVPDVRPGRCESQASKRTGTGRFSANNV